MTWTPDDSSELLRTYRKDGSRLIKRLNGALADPPPTTSGLDPVLQAARYEKLVRAADWKALHAAAVAEQRQADHALRTLGKQQTNLRRILAERAALPPPPPGGFQLNDLPNWRDARAGIIESAGEHGADERFAASFARRVGQLRIDVADLSARASDLVSKQGGQLNALARSHLRRRAGASLCQVLARFNDPGTVRDGDTDPPADALREPEQAVWQGLRSGGDGKEATSAYAAAAKTAVERCVSRLRSLPDDSTDLLDATLDAQEALEATLLARYFAWFLAWGVGSGLDDDLGQYAQLPFESAELPWEASLGAHRYRAQVGEIHDVRSARCTRAGTHIAVAAADGKQGQVAVHDVDLAYFGFTGSGRLRVAARVEHGHESRLIDVPIAGSAADWRSSVRQRVRGMYNPVPFGLSAAWSWSRGADGALAQVTDCGWFS